MLKLIRFAVMFACVSSAALNAEDAWDSCFEQAGERYGVNVDLLKAVATTESNMNPDAVNKKSNDFGIMQINEFWIPKLLEYGITKDDLFDPCTNINVGAWILADSILRYGQTWKAVGAYNAGTKDTLEVEKRRMYYANKVYNHYLAMTK